MCRHKREGAFVLFVSHIDLNYAGGQGIEPNIKLVIWFQHHVVDQESVVNLNARKCQTACKEQAQHRNKQFTDALLLLERLYRLCKC